MIRTMTTATNTLGQLQHHIDLIGNNLANVSTHGYKASEAKFHEMLYQQFHNDKADEAPRQSPLGIRYGTGALLGQAQVNWKVGGLQSTGRPLDFALTEPKHYFNVLMPVDGGTRNVYTRQGNFYISPVTDNRVMLVTGEGYPIADPSGNPITFTDQVQSYTVKSNGILQLTYQNGTIEDIALGITAMERPNVMEHISSTMIGFPNNLAELGVREEEIAVNLQGERRQMIGLENGALEGSNVNVQKEMTDLISVQRSYQFNARTVTLADQMLGLINNIR